MGFLSGKISDALRGKSGQASGAQVKTSRGASPTKAAKLPKGVSGHALGKGAGRRTGK